MVERRDEAKTELLKEGDHFGDYTVVKLLGKGGMGAVYLMQGTSGSQYAVKIMFPEKVSHEMRRRFAKEAEFAIKIRHRNLVSVYDVGEDPETGLCYMIMDYVSGGTLSDRLKEKGRFSIQEAVPIVSQIAAALDVAHRHGLVHRDIKPDNIMFDADGTPRLSDLGVAKFDDAQQSMVTTTGMVIGTPAYMAPEQMLNSHEIDARADIYSLGVVLYEMLSGKRPNEGRTAIELMAKAIKGEPLPDIKTMCPELSVAVAHVVSLLCAPKPEARPQTALDAADLLHKAASGKLMLVRKAPQSSTAEAAALRGKRKRLIKGIAIGIGIVAILFVGIAGWIKALNRQDPATPAAGNQVTNVLERVAVVTNVVERTVVGTNVGIPSSVTVPQRTATLVHRWSFNGKTEEEKLTDSVGGLVATKIGDAVTFEDGQAVLSGAGHGTGSLNLGKGILGDDSATIEIWATRTAFKRFARVFDYGIDSGTYFSLSWNIFSSRDFGVEVFKNTVPLRREKRPVPWRDNEEIYIAVTVKTWTDGTLTIKWNVFDSMNGVKKDQGVLNLQSDEIKILDFAEANFYLGHSQYPADADANATYNEVRIWKGVLPDADIARNVKLGPDVSTAELYKPSIPQYSQKEPSKKVQLWVDGPYWATTNIGANNPWECGLYFWWGDTTGHRPSSDGTFCFSFNFNADNSAIHTNWKSMAELQSAGWVTSDGVLAPGHDAAHVHWGGGWRMPTYQELSDLNSKCDWTWTATNGVQGYVVRGRGGYASNYIFLPAAGIGSGTSLGGSDGGLYWSSVSNSNRNNSVACELIFSSGDHGNGYAIRSLGLTVRPVQGGTKQRKK